MLPLILHPTCDRGPIKAVTAKVHGTPNGCKAEFRIEGDMTRVKIPDHAPSTRADNLWRTTCFEIFWQPVGGTSYREINLAPSSHWAAYDFDSFREGMRDAPIPSIAVSCSRNDNELRLEASIAADLPDPAQVGLSAVIEDQEGNIQYWALAFPPGKPDFHSEVCRSIILDRML